MHTKHAYKLQILLPLFVNHQQRGLKTKPVKTYIKEILLMHIYKTNKTCSFYIQNKESKTRDVLPLLSKLKYDTN